MHTITLRKNFTMPEAIAKNLEFLAKKMHKKQSQVLQELIQDKMKEFEKEKKLQAVERMSGIFTGKIPEHVSIQSIKANNEDQ